MLYDCEIANICVKIEIAMMYTYFRDGLKREILRLIKPAQYNVVC